MLLPRPFMIRLVKTRKGFFRSVVFSIFVQFQLTLWQTNIKFCCGSCTQTDKMGSRHSSHAHGDHFVAGGLVRSRRSSYTIDPKMAKLAEDLECRWLLPDEAFKKLIRQEQGHPITMEKLKKYFCDLGLERVWLLEAEEIFRKYEQHGGVNMQSFVIAMESVQCERMAKRAANSKTLPTIHTETINNPDDKYVGLVAHNHMKSVLIHFIEDHVECFKNWPIVTTGSTGASLQQYLNIEVAKKVSSGPLGGDQEIGAMISQGQISALFFFQDPLDSHPHQHDIHALVRLCDVYQVPYATNQATAIALLGLIKDLGITWQLGESEVVQTYKDNQKKVI
eukprot:TRINITY_DN17160_c0_g1_i3.p1 TRINITY_DN17160_c0_g1~~TRINITY_DN17160_c0_g1_i3.p1  ORF type:complete len:336 (+),score=44.91 TRINITY_DN17160_c0_g1_i3:135-1142(+)